MRKQKKEHSRVIAVMTVTATIATAIVAQQKNSNSCWRTAESVGSDHYTSRSMTFEVGGLIC